MNARFKIAALAALVAAGQLLALGQASRAPEAQLKAAHDKAEFEGDPKAAIEMYRKIAESKDRAIAAKALLGMADAYRQLGDAQARKIYERIVKEFSAQTQSAAEARARLDSLQPKAVANTGLSAREFTVARPWDDVSPDGRYAWNGSLHDIANGTDRPFDIEGTGISDVVRFSKDSKKLAYGWMPIDPIDSANRGYELRIINFQTGGQPQVRFRFGPDIDYFEPHDWTPDDKWIVISQTLKEGTTQIGMVSVADGSLRILRSADWRGPSRMFVSPDGRYLAYSLQGSNTNRQDDVFVLALDGSRQEVPVAEATDDVVRGWSPDGRYLIFSSEGDSGEANLRAVPIRDGKSQGNPRLIEASWGRDTRDLGITASGALYYRVPGPLPSLRIADINLGAALIQPSVSPSNGVAGSGLPVFSRDGKYIAYKSISSNRLIIRSLETGQIAGEVRPALDRFAPNDWSPDGRSFLVNGIDLKGRRALYQVDAQTSAVSRLTGDCRFCVPKWAPDGKSIYYGKSIENTMNVLKIGDLESGKETEVLRIPGGTRASFGPSPDGRYMAFNSERVVSVVALNGGETRNLVEGRFLAWTPDSRSVVATATVEGVSVLSIVSLDGEVRRIRGVNGQDFRVNTAVVVSPDGKHLGFIETKTQPLRIGVLENFLAALETPPQTRSTRLDKPINQLTWVDRTGRVVGTLGPPARFQLDKSFSSDGTRVAVSMDEPNGENIGSAIGIVDVRNGTMTRLSSSPEGGGAFGSLAWSPDGTWIAFISTRNGKQGLYLKRADGTGSEELLVESVDVNHLSWSADSKTIVFTKFDLKTLNDLWSVPITGSRKPTLLLQTEFTEQGGQVSPDGKWLAYVSNRSGQSRVYIRPFPTGSSEWEVPSPAGSHSPTWRPDSKELYVTAGMNLAIEVRASGSSIQFGTPEELGYGDFRPVTLDGRRFLINRSPAR